MYIIEMIINIKYSEQNKHNKKEKKTGNDGKVYCIS